LPDLTRRIGNDPLVTGVQRQQLGKAGGGLWIKASGK
jgi:hypothetical protein